MAARRSRGAASSASGEFALLAKVRRLVASLGKGRGVLVGIGDDCAVVESPSRPLVLTTDTMVEGVHFRAAWLTPRELGVRAFRASVSDIAAMGAAPRYVLLSLELPAAGLTEREALALVRAVASESRRTGAALVGGNVSGGPRLAVTVTVVGEAVGAPLLRSGARAGDVVFVTGSLGGSAAGCRVLSSSSPVRPADTAAYRRPPVRLAFAAALSKSGLAHSMVDVSDGLVQDLGHIAAESRVAIRVEARAVPVHPAAARQRSSVRGGLPLSLELALAGGEDYELAFTAPAKNSRAIERLAARLRTRVSRIGTVEKGATGVTDPEGGAFPLRETGFEHLLPRRAQKTALARPPGRRNEP